MKTKIFKLIAAGPIHLAVCLLLLSGCNKDQIFDFNGSDSAKIFFTAYQPSNPASQLKNQLVYSVTQSPVGVVKYDDIALSIPVKTTLPVNADMKVKVAVDNSLIDTYNKANGTAYVQVPAGVIDVTNTDLTITQNDFSSSQSVSVKLNAAQVAQLADSKGYLIPLKIVSLENQKDAVISANLNVIYIVVGVNYTFLKQGGIDTDITGSLITDRSAWTATSTNITSTGTYKSMFDGLTTTASRWGFTAGPVEIIVDLQKEEKITGLRFNTYSTSFPILSLTLATSTDGVTYTNRGTISPLPASNGFFYGALYAPVNARFVKTTMTWSTTTATYLSLLEYNVYKSN